MSKLRREHLRDAILTLGACLMLLAFVVWTLVAVYQSGVVL